ncbi:hypothetical protein ABTD83_20020, partial [Acinetobacter baumannii]
MEQNNILAEETLYWLKVLTSTDAETKATENIQQLKAVLRFNEYRYYVLNNALISDNEYDALYKLLEKVEKNHP